MNRKKLVEIIVIYILMIVMSVLFDYFNVFHFITSQMNSNYFGILLNTLTTIFLFILSYILINKKINESETDRKINKETSLFIMLKETYDDCYETVEFFCNESTLKKYIVPKVDFKSTNDTFLEFQIDRVFKYDLKILDMVSDGVVNKETLKQYLSIKKDFHDFINLKVALFDINSPYYEKNIKAHIAKKNIDSLEVKLKNNLKREIKIVNDKLGGEKC